jgi:putative ABC transport system permease protein
LSAQPRARILVRAAGAIPDAWSLFRQQWSLDMLAQDVRYAWRLLRQRTGYTALIIGTLAIGIGANTAMFSVIEGVLLRTLPYPDPSRLVRIWENDRVHGTPRYTVAPANFADWRAQSHALASMSVFLPEGVSLSDGEDPFHANVAVVSTDFLRTLGVRPMIGRDFTAADTPPAQRVLILSHAAWMSHFGGDPGILERTVQLGDKPYRVIAIMGRDFGFPDRTVDAWRPMAESPDLMAVRAQHFFNVIARVKPGATLTQARDDLEAIAVAEQRAYPATNEQRGTTMVRLQDALVGDVRAPMVYLGAAVVLLLLIGCANVANLMLAQASARRREIAVRAALGADRLRIVRQLLVEGLLLAGAGGLAGLAIAEWGTRLVGRMAVDYIPRMADVGMDPWMLGYAAVLSIVTGLVFALAPAVRASRADVQQDLRDGGRGATSSGRGMRRTLVVVEFAAAVVLVTGAGLLFGSFRHVLRIDPGFATSQVLSVETELPQSRYGEDAALTRFYADFLARVSALPGVRAAGVVNNLPLSNNAWTSSLRIENRPEPQGQPPEVGYRSASAGYLRHGDSVARRAMVRRRRHGDVSPRRCREQGPRRTVLPSGRSRRRADPSWPESEGAVAQHRRCHRERPTSRPGGAGRTRGVRTVRAGSIRRHRRRSRGRRSGGGHRVPSCRFALDRSVRCPLPRRVDGRPDGRTPRAATSVAAARRRLRRARAGTRAPRHLRCHELFGRAACAGDRGARRAGCRPFGDSPHGAA